MDNERIPSSVDTEKSILGAFLLDNDLLKSEGMTVTTEDFHLGAHRKIYARMAEMSEQGLPIDPMTLGDFLGGHKELTEVGGVTYLSTLTTGVPKRSSVAHYCRILRKKTLLRKLLYLAEHIQAKATDPESSPEEIIETTQKDCLEFALSAGESEGDIFVDASEFCKGSDDQPDWLIEGLVERGSNGIVAADPKGAKSLTVAGGLSVCLALGIPWLGLPVKRCRVALVSREDNPSTTKRRIRQIVKGKGARIEELRGWLHVNSKEQSKSLMLDNPREVNNLIRCLKKWKSEFVILDVFNKLHVQDENDNTKVRAVMNQVDRIAAETGVQVCILHHWNKGDASQSLTRRIRGAGAIAGFAEWIGGIEMQDEKSQVRCIKFETKVGEQPKPIYYQIVDEKTDGGIKFHLVAIVEDGK